MADNEVKVKAVITAEDRASASMRSFGNSVDNVSDKIVRTAKVAALAFGAATTAVVAYSVKSFADYEQSLNVFQAVSGATEAQMKQVGNTAKALGKDMTLPGISAKDAAGAMTELAKAGLSVSDSLAAAKGVLSLAKAGQLDTAEAAQIAANALNAFSLKGGEATRVADLLAAAANASSASVHDVALGLQMSSASAASMKVPVQDLVTLLAQMSNNGIRGSDAGTSLKTMFMSLTPNTAKASKEMKKLNLDFFDAKGNFIGVRETIAQLQKNMSGLTDEQKSMSLQTMFGTDAFRAANVMLKEGVAGYDKLSTAVNKQGAATDLAAAQNKGLNGAIDNLKSNAETLAIEVGEKLAPYVRQLATYLSQNSDEIADFAQKSLETGIAIGKVLVPAIVNVAKAVGNLAKWFTELSPTMQKIVITGGVMALTFIPVLNVVLKLASGIRLLTGAAAALSAVGTGGGFLAALASPAGLGVAAVAITAALGFGLYKLMGNIDDAKNKTDLYGESTAKASKETKDFTQLAKDLGVKIEGTASKVDMLTLAQTHQKDAQNLMVTAAKKVDQTQAAINAQADVTKQKTEAVAIAQKAVNDNLTQFGIKSPEYQAAVQALKDRQIELNNAQFDGLKKSLDLTIQTGYLKDAIRQNNMAVGDATSLQQFLNDQMKGGVGVIAQFGPVANQQVQGVATLQNSIGQLVTSWNGAVVNIQNQSVDINNRLQGIGSTIDRVQGQSITLNASLAGAAANSSSILQNAGQLQGHAAIPKRALGGPVTAAKTYLVGENGPEYFTPNSSGSITPNSATRGRSTGTTVNQETPKINITIQAGAFMGTQMEARKFASMIIDAYKDGMAAKGMAIA